MFKNLINRIKAEETRLGKIFAYYLPSALAIVATTVECLEQIQVMPFDVPFDVKNAIGILTFIGFVGGKLTKKQEDAK